LKTTNMVESINTQIERVVTKASRWRNSDQRQLKTISFPVQKNLTVERLTALWALNEAGLGGVMHAVKSPFTGILVGGTAIMLITLIAYFAQNRTRAILKATMIVLLIKFTVSPHSPLPAYFAVSFQALLGAVLFGAFSNLRLAALLLGILGLLETALQKILVMTIVYGNSLWESIDVFFNYVLQQFGLTAAADFRASLWLIGLYVGLHALAGVFVGWLAGNLPNEIRRALADPARRQLPRPAPVASRHEIGNSQKPFWKGRVAKIFLLLIIVASILTFLTPAMAGYKKGIYVILRAAVVLSLWYFVAAPLVMKLLQRFLKNKSARHAEEIKNILRIFPRLKEYARWLWPASAPRKGWRRWKHFLVALVVFALTFEDDGEESAAGGEKTEQGHALI
ncbi:MAG: hypothetical protein ACK4Q5_21220, partial [Saprospiraceae bacterium]